MELLLRNTLLIRALGDVRSRQLENIVNIAYDPISLIRNDLYMIDIEKVYCKWNAAAADCRSSEL